MISALGEQAGRHGLHDEQTLRDVDVACQRAARLLALVVRDPADGAELARWLAAECSLTVAFTRLRTCIQRDFDLQTNPVIGELTVELASTENKIAFARQAYNDWVASFNAQRRGFPRVALACLLGFGRDLAPLTDIKREQIDTAPVVALHN